MQTTPTPTRSAEENEDRYSQIYIQGVFHTYLPKGMRLKDFDKQMKSQGYRQTGFSIGGPYMKVNFVKQ